MKILIVLGLIALAGCQKQDSTSTPTSPCAAGTTCVSKLDASSAVAYYNQFIEQTIGTCADPTTMRFQWLGLTNRLLVGKDSTGNDIVAELNLFLEADGTYTGEYQENIQKLTAPGYYQDISAQNQKQLKGTWSIQGTQLIISDVGTVDGGVDNGVNGAVNGVVAINNWPGLMIPVKTSAISAQLLNQNLLMTNVRSSISKEMKTVAQVCKDQADKAAKPAPATPAPVIPVAPSVQEAK